MGRNVIGMTEQPTTPCPTCGQPASPTDWVRPADVCGQPDPRGAVIRFTCGHERRGAEAIRLIEALPGVRIQPNTATASYTTPDACPTCRLPITSLAVGEMRIAHGQVWAPVSPCGHTVELTRTR